MKPFAPRTILVPTDLSDASNAALVHARRLAEAFEGELTLVHAERIEPPVYFTSSQLQRLLEERRSQRQEAAEYVARQAAEALGVTPRTFVEVGAPTDVILETMDKIRPDLVVMGTHGRSGIRRFWMGSVTERVIRANRAPVLAVHEGGGPRFERILGAVSAEDAGGVVLAAAASLAERFDAPLSLVHAAAGASLPERCPGLSEALERHCRIEETIVKGDAATNILRVAQRVGADLIVMGGRRWVSVLGEFFSTTTEKVMRSATTSLLVVPLKDVEE